ncbi:hypothetical protein LTR37_017465 [Vermiconidia calcicola]|uniref:Uncharacterized protein n=1 Tax=Vermiconidia calcicola TaxID=1690605 RepID=A0ACC3MJU4_9PEZI|nr:hypothetical protein LTR37_017465 [Vermiconidia calcicola]
MAAPPFRVKAVFEYTSEHEDDLNFPIGQVITVVELEGEDWYVGEYTDVTGGKHEGLFPANFVEKYEPEVPTRPTRPARQKQEAQQSAPVPMPAPAQEESEDEEEAAPVPATSKPTASPVEIPQSATKAEEMKSPLSASSPKVSPAKMEPPSAPKPAPAEPAETEPESASSQAKKAPPPVAAKSNAFKDRIAAFNQPAAAPVAPMQQGRQGPAGGFVKKPFVAPPPSKNAYVPQPKVEPVHKPYVRDEDPEIKQRQEEDRAAAQAAGLASESSATAKEAEDSDAPKPMTLKERMALLQKQQEEQAQRRAETAPKKEKKVPQKKASGSSQHAMAPEAETEELERVRSDTTERQSLDVARDKPRMPFVQRRPQEQMSPMPGPPESEVLSDGHEADQSGAGEMTEDDSGTLGPDDSDETSTEADPVAHRGEPDVGEAEDVADSDEAEEEEEVDEETRRKEELRARMARLGGGMPGMGGPFNPFGAPPPAPPRKKQASKDRAPSEDTTPQQPQQRIPMMPVSGMQRRQSPESDATERVGGERETQADREEESDGETPAPPPTRVSTIERDAPPVPKESRPVPPVPPQERGAPPPVPSGGVTPRAPAAESRQLPPPPPTDVPASPGPGSESDDEMSTHAKRSSAETSGAETILAVRTGVPPVPGTRELPPRPPQSPDTKRTSYFSSSDPHSATADKRSSRAVPPIPGSPPVTSPRPPPPPPPTQVPSRQPTMDVDEDERVGSDYDGDYDTDIASSAKHKDALKADHQRDVSLTEMTMGDDTPIYSPLPQASAPRAVPPPPPEIAPPKTRPSMDRPPPPVPPGRDPSPGPDYDPHRYESGRRVPSAPSGAPLTAPPIPPREPQPLQDESSADELYAPPSPPPRKSTDRAPLQEHAVPTLPQERAVPPPPQQAPPSQAPGRTSLDVHRTPTTGRRSMEQSRTSGEHGQMANDVNLSQDTPWWTTQQPLPPSLQSRNGVDIVSESEESSKSKRGGKKEITKDIYILYMDYSQTVISARYDSQEPADIHLEQRHEPPAPKLRQDQLEAAWQRFGTKIAGSASQLGQSKKDSVVGDGSPYSLPLELIRAQQGALLPVGTRAYGALVYANLANASTMQFDEIRRGDIITIRNARFEGHHGAMKTKYKIDYGVNHVAVVEEWDGTRRAVRAWEQGREKKGGVRSEKFRLGDLRSGEVRVWRVVGRDWVGWDS